MFAESTVCVCAVRVCVCVCVCNLVAVVDGGDDLSEDASGFCLWQSSPLLYVIIELSSAGVLHHYHNLIPALEHCQQGTFTVYLYTDIR